MRRRAPIDFELLGVNLDQGHPGFEGHLVAVEVDSHAEARRGAGNRVEDSGAINEGDLARIQTQKLEADQALDQAVQTLRQARVAPNTISFDAV